MAPSPVRWALTECWKAQNSERVCCAWTGPASDAIASVANISDADASPSRLPIAAPLRNRM